MSWQSSASAATLKARAELLATVRAFFARRDVLEVITPLLCQHGVTDPAIEPFESDSAGQLRYLQTSPEYAMKRLLADGVGAIYQIAAAFRKGEAGARHNPEFTLLEWYRPGFDDHALMDEVADLVMLVLGRDSHQRISYRQLFVDLLDIDPFVVTVGELGDFTRQHIELSFTPTERDTWLDLLMSHLIEPELAKKGVCFVYDYPPSQAALARITERDGVKVGRRFELYVDGLELANGYYELQDAAEQAVRFERDNALRVSRGLQAKPVDHYLLSALEHGLPDCAGVALGLDRLLMCQLGECDIRKTLAFDWARA